jgi:S1-C subfamily serine protease
MKNWYWWRLNKVVGPFDENDLVKLEKSGKLHSHSKLRKGQSEAWVEFKNVRNEVYKNYVKPRGTVIPSSDSKLIEEAFKINVQNEYTTNYNSLYLIASAFLLTIFGLSVLLLTSGSMREFGSENDQQPLDLNLSSKNSIGVRPSVIQSGDVQTTDTNDIHDKLPHDLQINTNNKPLGTEELIKRVESSIAVIQGKYGSGSGFLINNNVVATNKHVIDGEFISQIRVIFPSDRESIKKLYSVSLIYEDPDLDIAFIQLDTKRNEYLNLMKNYELRKGQDVIIIGSPGSRINDGKRILENVVAKGIMSTKALVEGTLYYHVSIFANPGNSGGAIVDYSGNVLCTPTLKENDKEGMLFCIPSDSILESYEIANELSLKRRKLIELNHEMSASVVAADSMFNLLLTAMVVYQKSMDEARNQGMSSQDGLNKTKEKINAYLEELKNDGLIDTQGLLTLISEKTISDNDYKKCILYMMNNIQNTELMLRTPVASTLEMSMFEFAKTHKQLREKLSAIIDSVIADLND